MTNCRFCKTPHCTTEAITGIAVLDKDNPFRYSPVCKKCYVSMTWNYGRIYPREPFRLIEKLLAESLTGSL